MKKNGFQFKQFFIQHDRCAMKVNTDGILLGALADTSNASEILDLGTGTGLVAIMLAQRTTAAQITAVELDPEAFKQACYNAQNSPWRERLNVIHADVMALSLPAKIDLIVANPPYFEASLDSRNEQRDLARRILTSHVQWLIQAVKLLSEKGKITFILPSNTAQQLINQAETLALHCIAQTRISTKPNHEPKRTVVTFSPQFSPLVEQHLLIYQADNQYSDEFKALTQAFYLNF